jgi:uncharacterized protein
MKKNNYKKGLRFKCQGSSNCCVSRDSYGYVYLSKKDVSRLSKFVDLQFNDFINLYCDETNGFLHLKEKKGISECLFLKNKKCSIYTARPTQCRTWPFWSENMNAKKWNKDISKFCPGIGKGKIIFFNNIQKKITEDDKNEYNIINKN